MVRVENERLHIRAVSFVFIYLDLMHNHPFWTLPVVISQQCCIEIWDGKVQLWLHCLYY